MKIINVLFIVLLVFHGVIHIPGFLKAFKLAEFEQLHTDISKTGGLFWLAASLAFLLAAILYTARSEGWVYPAAVAVILSSALIILTWKDARFGMIPNVIVLFVAVVSFLTFSMNAMITREKAEILSYSGVEAPKIIMAEETMALPVPVRKWLMHSGVTERPAIQTAWVKQKAEMKMKPSQQDWTVAYAEQYITTEKPAFIWTVQMNMSQFLKFRGRDKFVDGRANMLIRMNSLVNIVNAKGEKLDEASLQRYLAELVWYPSMALSPYITWEAIDEHSARASLSYRGTKGSGVFYFNDEGDFVKFIAQRYKGNKPDDKRYEWVITGSDYTAFEGIRVPSKMNVTWRLEEGDWTWLRLEVEDIIYNNLSSLSLSK